MPKFYTVCQLYRKSPFEALCTVCNCSFNIKNGGKSNINPHTPTAMQKRWVIYSCSTKEGDTTNFLDWEKFERYKNCNRH